MKKSLLIALALTLSLCFLFSCAAPAVSTGEDAANLSLVTPESYTALMKAVKSARNSRGYLYYKNGTALAVDRMDAVAEDAAAAPAAQVPTDPDHTGTNLQHEGVDEADIVKTDGRYIYTVFSDGIKYLCVTPITPEGVGEPVRMKLDLGSSDKHSRTSEEYYPLEMYVSGGRLVLIANRFKREVDPEELEIYRDKLRSQFEELDPETRGEFDDWIADLSVDYDGDGEADDWYPYWMKRTVETGVWVGFFDIADPTNPVFIGSSGFSGTYSSSRVRDGVLYIVTTEYVSVSDDDDPEKIVPRVYEDSVGSPVPEDSIYYDPVRGGACFVTLGSVMLDTGRISDAVSLLSDDAQLYMSPEDIFIYSVVYDYSSSVFGGAYSSKTETDIIRVTADGADLKVAARGSVEGSPVNQFSFDQYGDHLRVVTRRSSYSNTLGVDKSLDDSALFVLDGDLEIVGSVGDCGRGEQLRSVRFDGDYAYFVTFRTTDPLFCADLSDPANPVILSQLKIPGFSTYLQPYGEGLLLGIGQDADEETGRTGGLKLSMFDVSDKTDVTEKHKLILSSENQWSEALYNHKAILADVNKNLIGFAAGDEAYFLYGYDPDNGFFERARIDLGGRLLSWYGVRGIYAGSLFYVAGPDGIIVLDPQEASVVTSVNFAEQIPASLIFDGAKVVSAS